MKCLFCDSLLEFQVSSYEIHIRYFHAIKHYQDFALSLFLLTEDEIEGIFSQYSTKLLEFKSIQKLETDINKLNSRYFPDTKLENFEIINLSDDDEETSNLKKEETLPVDQKNLNHEIVLLEECKNEKIVESHTSLKQKITERSSQEKEENIFVTNFKKEHNFDNKLENISKNQPRKRGRPKGKLKNNILVCNICLKEFHLQRALKSHLNKKHNASRKEEIKRKFKETCKSKNDVQCHLCYKTPKNLPKHYIRSHKTDIMHIDKVIPKNKLKFDCKQCDFKFVSKNSLGIHLREHSYQEFNFLKELCFDKITKKLKCVLCYINFPSFSHIVRHVTGYHKSEIELVKSFPNTMKHVADCPECHEKFITDNSLFVHRILAHYPMKNNFCTLCGVELKLRGAYIHRNLYHKDELHALQKKFTENERKIKCTECGNMFFTKGSLRFHMYKSCNSPLLN